MSEGATIEDLLRQLAPRVLGVLVRRHGDFDAGEDAVQEALLAAASQWAASGIPANPRGWLITVAERRFIDQVRNEQARRRREADALVLAGPHAAITPALDDERPADQDDTLTLLFLCCHPALTPASQIALTLRAVGGLTTAEIARAFLVPEATMAQRISRAKARIKATDAEFRPPTVAERPARLKAVLHVLYLVFNEEYTASSGSDLLRVDLTTEAIRLTRMVRQLLPDDGEIAGLLALMLLTDARRPVRMGADGGLIPLAEQNRTRWDQAAIAEGIALISDALTRTVLGPYQLQAAIAAVHDQAPSAEETDWPQILALYGLLERIAPNPVVTLNRAVAIAMVRGPHAGLALLDILADDDRLTDHHRLAAVRAHLLEMAGEPMAAREAYFRLHGAPPAGQSNATCATAPPG